ncbi:MAG: MurR/RpiR family transcriptional regulator [Pseudomonadota bacterium]
MAHAISPDSAAPQSVEEFHQHLQAISDDLPKRMRQCAEYLAANTDRIALSTVAELAAGAGVQPSALMRFCQIMGFSGYSEMQKLFRTAFTPGMPDYTTRLTNLRERGADSPSALLAEFVDAGRMSLENLANSVDPRILDEAVATLAQAEMIHLIGLRRAFPVASYLAYAFDKMRIPAMLHDGTGKLDHSSALRSGDVVAAITFTPYSQETVVLAEEAIRRGLPVVAITDTVLSPLNLPGVLKLSVSEVDFGAFRALSATLSLAITLAVATGTRRDAAAEL